MNFTKAERRILHLPWPDGTTRKVDPLRIGRRLMHATDGDLWELWKLSDQVRRANDRRAEWNRKRADWTRDHPGRLDERRPEGADPDAYEATEQLLEAAAWAFELPPWDEGEGAGEGDIWACLNAYTAFLAKKGAGEGATFRTLCAFPWVGPLLFTPDRPFRYGDFVALELMADEAELVQAWVVLRGTVAAQSRKPLSPAWFLARAGTKAEALKMAHAAFTSRVFRGGLGGR